MRVVYGIAINICGLLIWNFTRYGIGGRMVALAILALVSTGTFVLMRITNGGRYEG